MLATGHLLCNLRGDDDIWMLGNRSIQKKKTNNVHSRYRVLIIFQRSSKPCRCDLWDGVLVGNRSGAGKGLSIGQQCWSLLLGFNDGKDFPVG